MVLAAGMRGRIRMAGDTLTVRIGVRDLKPLRPEVRRPHPVRWGQWSYPRSSPAWV